MKLIATKTLRYGTRSLRAGDEFDASPRDGKLLKAIGRAIAAPEPTPPKPRAYRAKPPEEAQAVTVRTEDPPPSPESWLAAAVPVQPESKPTAPKPRTYTRRDLVADE